MIRLRVPPGAESARSLARVKMIAWDHPGEHELELRVGSRQLRLGPAWGYSADGDCLAALSEFGEVVDVEEPGP